MTITIGTDSITKKPYRIDPTRHISIIGGSGVGKSSLLENIFVGFCKNHGGVILDPHGDVAHRLPLLLPKHRRDDIIFLDPDKDCPQFNPLHFRDPEELELAKETCLTLLKALAGDPSSWGNATPYNVRNDLDAVCESVKNPTLVHVFRWLTDDKYRKRLLNKSKNPFVHLFSKQELPQEAFNAAINKVAKLMRPNILSVIGWPESLDLLDCMNSGKILICRLSKGALGEETAQILYSLIVSLFSIAALKREKQSDRPPFIIVADEAQNASHGGRFGTLLAEARKYGISLCIAQQGFYQTTFRDDILTNAATQIVFNSSGEDAETMAKNWNDERVLPAHITSLSRYEFYVRTFEKNQTDLARVNAPPQLTIKFRSEEDRQATLEKILHQSRRRYAVPRKHIDSNVKEILA